MADCPAKNRKLSALFDLFGGDDVIFSMAKLLDEKKVVNRSAKVAFASFLQLSDNQTRPSVLGTAQTHLRLFDSDLVRRLTDTTTIDIDALIEGKPLSLYIIVPPARLTAYRPVLRMWLSGLILALTLRKTRPKERTLMSSATEIGNLRPHRCPAPPRRRCSGPGDLTLWTFWQNAATPAQIYGAPGPTRSLR